MLPSVLLSMSRHFIHFIVSLLCFPHVLITCLISCRACQRARYARRPRPAPMALYFMCHGSAAASRVESHVRSTCSNIHTPEVACLLLPLRLVSEPGAMELIGSHVLCFLVIGVCLFLRIHFGCLHFNDHVWSVCIERCLGSTCKLSLPGMSGENEAAIHREVRLRALGTSSHPVSNICLYKGLLQTTLLKARFPQRFGLAFQHGVKWPE